MACNLRTLKTKAKNLLIKEKYEDSIVLIKKILKKEPSSSHWLTRYSYALLGLKKYEEALEKSNLAVEADDTDDYAYLIRGNVKAESGDILGALDDFEESYLIGGFFKRHAIFGKVFCNCKMGNKKEALRLCDEMISAGASKEDIDQIKDEINFFI